MKLGKLWIQYHRMPKWLPSRSGRYRTTAPSYLRVFWDRQFVFDFPVPKYGTSR